MTNEFNTRDLMEYGLPTGTIQIVPQPKKIIDVDPEILAVMNARLQGVDYSEYYEEDENLSNQLIIQQEKRKLRKIFSSSSDICTGFNSLKNIREIKEEMKFEDVDRELLKKYSEKLYAGEHIDEVDFYKSFLFNDNIITKDEHIQKKKDLFGSFDIILSHYKEFHFDLLSITREMIQMDSKLATMLNKGNLASFFDEMLLEFYGENI
ncbi:hypothetical protein [Halobacteriovorax sp. ZH1_bin.1]|uniref:hypothetical protein n=1 Tax=Halobacteriovorax sp. ZH1_bin.1 TaxID=3157723 RepID=UPI00371895BF